MENSPVTLSFVQSAKIKRMRKGEREEEGQREREGEGKTKEEESKDLRKREREREVKKNTAEGWRVSMLHTRGGTVSVSDKGPRLKSCTQQSVAGVSGEGKARFDCRKREKRG